MTNAVWLAKLLLALLFRPHLWVAAFRQLLRMAGRRWWSRPPFLPLPAGSYARFRLVTQYGRADVRPTVRDVLVWLAWTRQFPDGRVGQRSG